MIHFSHSGPPPASREMALKSADSAVLARRSRHGLQALERHFDQLAARSGAEDSLRALDHRAGADGQSLALVRGESVGASEAVERAQLLMERIAHAEVLPRRIRGGVGIGV